MCCILGLFFVSLRFVWAYVVTDPLGLFCPKKEKKTAVDFRHCWLCECATNGTRVSSDREKQRSRNGGSERSGETRIAHKIQGRRFAGEDWGAHQGLCQSRQSHPTHEVLPLVPFLPWFSGSPFDCVSLSFHFLEP